VSKCKDVATPISWYRDEDTCDKGTTTRPPVSPPRPPGTVVRNEPPPVAQSPSGASLRSSSSGRGKAQPSQAPLSQEQQGQNQDCFACACNGPVPLEGFCSQPVEAAATSESSSDSFVNSTITGNLTLCDMPENTKHKDVIETGGKLCPCLRMLYDYVESQSPDVNSASSFIDLRKPLNNDYTDPVEERIGRLQAAMDIGACLDQRGYLTFTNVSQVLDEFQTQGLATLPVIKSESSSSANSSSSSVPVNLQPSFTYTYSDVQTNAMELKYLLALQSCSSKGQLAFEAQGDWKDVPGCETFVDILKQAMTNVSSPMTASLKQMMDEEVRGKLVKPLLETLKSMNEELFVIPLDSEVRSLCGKETDEEKGFVDTSLQVAKILFQLEEFEEEIQVVHDGLDKVLAAEESQAERVLRFVNFLDQQKNLPAELSLWANDTMSNTNAMVPGSEYVLARQQQVMQSAEKLLMEGGLSDISETTRSLADASQRLQAAAVSLESVCPSFAEKRQAMQELAANMAKASALVSNIQSIANSLQLSGKSVSKPLQGKGSLGVVGMDVVMWDQWYEINVFLPCVSGGAPPPFTMSSYPEVLITCNHQVVLVMPSESSIGLKTVISPDPASDLSDDAKDVPGNGVFDYRSDPEEVESVGK